MDEHETIDATPDFLKSRRQPSPRAADLSKLDRLPPYAMEAEQGVLGCCLLEPKESIGLCIEKLRGGGAVFYDLRHQQIYELLVDMYSENESIDLITVQQKLKDKNQLEAIGGLAYLCSLQDAVPSAANLTYYLAIVREKYLLRRVIQVCSSTIARVYEHEGEVDALLDQFEAEALQVGQDRVMQKDRAIKEVVNAVISQIEENHARQGQPSGVPSGFADLDRITSGMHGADMIVIGARPSEGKAQPLTAKILTPTGWKLMGEMKVGDFVIGQDGKPKKVLGVFPQGIKPVYRVAMRGGGSTECCADHLWLTHSRSERKNGYEASVKPLKDILGNVQIFTGGARLNHTIPFVEPVHFMPAGETPVDPWLLGFWLGDGSYLADVGCVNIHNPEEDMLSKVTSRLPGGDHGVRVEGYRASDCPSIRITGTARKQSSFGKALARMSLRGKTSEFKFIPEGYMTAKPAIRLELLRGLVDSDGYVNRGIAEVCTASAKMAEQIQLLVWSLGGKCQYKKFAAYYVKDGKKHTCLDKYRIQLHFSNGITPWTSQKHLARPTPKKGRISGRYINSVTEVGEKECQCIMVEGGLYVTDDFIVTHNTALGMTIARNVALDSKLPVGVFSLEMTSESLVMRMLSAESQVTLASLRDGSLCERDFAPLTNAASRIAKSNLHIDDSEGLSILQIRAKARRMWQQHGIKLIVVDYLQLLKSTSKRAGTREQEIADISQGLKSMAKELNIPVIVLAQLNRGLEKEKGRKPRLSDLRESGSIEQDADLVLLLHRPPPAEGQEEEPQSECQIVNAFVAKQRNGQRDVDIALTFRKGITRFENAAFETEDRE